jgi:large subunit ribosomal protein L9
MKVLLLQRVENLGHRGDMMNVSDGYARNFLIPRKLATPATEGVEAYATRLRQDEDKRRELENAQLAETREKLAAVSCTISRKAGDDEKLFGSVTPADVADALNRQGFSIEKRKVTLDDPIKALGVFTVKIKLSPDHEADVKVWVVREAETA